MEYLPECANNPAANVLACAVLRQFWRVWRFSASCMHLVRPARFPAFYGCFYGVVRPVLVRLAMEFLRPFSRPWFSVFRQNCRALCRQNCVLWRFMALHVYIYVYRRFALPMAFFRAYGVRWHPADCQYFGAVPRIAAGNIM